MLFIRGNYSAINKIIGVKKIKSEKFNGGNATIKIQKRSEWG